MCPVAFSDVEKELIRQLPPAGRNGLKLAKAMRIKTLFPDEILNQLQEIFHLEDCLKTYMIKTSLFLCHKTNKPYMQHLSRDEWANVIFLHLQIRLETNGCIPSIFELDETESITTLFLCDDPIDLSPNYQRQCCVRRKNLWLIATHLAGLLLLRLAGTGRVGMLTRLALRASVQKVINLFRER